MSAILYSARKRSNVLKIFEFRTKSIRKYRCDVSNVFLRALQRNQFKLNLLQVSTIFSVIFWGFFEDFGISFCRLHCKRMKILQSVALALLVQNDVSKKCPFSSRARDQNGKPNVNCFWNILYFGLTFKRSIFHCIKPQTVCSS